MLLISHVAVGGLVAKSGLGLALSLPLAFASHFLLDAIPHAQAPTDVGYRPNKKTYPAVATDLLFVAIYLAWYQVNFGISAYVLLIMIFSVLPDLLDLLRYNTFLFRIFSWYFNFHDKVQKETWRPVGYISQIIVVAGSILLTRYL